MGQRGSSRYSSAATAGDGALTSARGERLSALCRRHAAIGLDSNVLIYLLEGGGRHADRAAALIDAIADGATTGVLATLGLAEILSGPARTTDAALVERYADELRSVENLALVAMDEEIAIEAALIRGRARASLADAIHLATARHAGASAFVTNDRKVPAVEGIDLIPLDTLELDGEAPA